MTEYLDEAISC